MAPRTTGLSRDLLSHPGETLKEVLEEKNISQKDLAIRAGVTPAFVSKVIAGEKDISRKFAKGLEYALGVDAAFWLNLQANYDAELLEVNEADSIDEKELSVYAILKKAKIVDYLRNCCSIPADTKREECLLQVRRVLKLSNLSSLSQLQTTGAFRISDKVEYDPYVLGAWIRICRMLAEQNTVHNHFDKDCIASLVYDLKNLMNSYDTDLQTDISTLMARYGINFTIVRHFSGAPVQGFISLDDGVLQMFLTIRHSYADIFWFSLFHELGHVVNGDVSVNFFDCGSDAVIEKKADLFASSCLLNTKTYESFLAEKDFSISAINSYSVSEGIPPYIVIGRLQNEKIIGFDMYQQYKPKYKWNDDNTLKCEK